MFFGKIFQWFKSIIVIIVLVHAFVLIGENTGKYLVGAKECSKVKHFHFWEHNLGSFRRLNDASKWKEFTAHGIPFGSELTVESEKDETVLLWNNEKRIYILLRPDQSGIRYTHQGNFEPLYPGQWRTVLECY